MNESVTPLLSVRPRQASRLGGIIPSISRQMLSPRQPSTPMTKALVFCLLALSPLQAAGPSYMITDGQSLKDGLDIHEEFQAGTRKGTWEETVRGTEAATYTQAFASACYCGRRSLRTKLILTYHQTI